MLFAMFSDLFKPARDPRGVDEGPCFAYWILSYRRKLIRDLWLWPIYLAITLGLWRFDPHYRQTPGLLLAAILLMFLSSSFNYYMWQKHEK